MTDGDAASNPCIKTKDKIVKKNTIVRKELTSENQVANVEKTENHSKRDECMDIEEIEEQRKEVTCENEITNDENMENHSKHEECEDTKETEEKRREVTCNNEVVNPKCIQTNEVVNVKNIGNHTKLAECKKHEEVEEKESENGKEDLYEVDDILGDKCRMGTKYLLIKWRGYKNKTWELEETITGTLKSEVEKYYTRKKFFSSKYILKGDSKTLSNFYKIRDVAPDGNCCFYVANNWLKTQNKINHTCINKFRKDLKEHIIENETYLKSKKFGLHNLYHGDFLKKLYAQIYTDGRNYKDGCGSNEWMSMTDLYPILVHKYGYFELIVFDCANGVFSYSTKKCSKGLLQATTSKVCITHMLSKNISLKETLICAFLSSHYYEVVAMNEDGNTNIN